MKTGQSKAQKKISEEILKYGEPVLRSEAFQAAYHQTHHLKGNLADHILNVTIEGVNLCRRLQKKKIDVDERTVVLACLCHDLGMVGRDEKYESRLESWKQHPEESLKQAKEICPDLDETAAAAIATHMWPIAGKAPRTREGRIVLAADKYASMIDWISFVKGKPWQQEIKEAVRKGGWMD